MNKSGKTLRTVAASVAVAAIAILAGGATAFAREPEVTTSNQAARPLNYDPHADDSEWEKYARQNNIPFYPNPSGNLVYPEANLAAVPKVTVEDDKVFDDSVGCAANTTVISVRPGGRFTFNGRMVSTYVTKDGISINTSANTLFAIIIFTGTGGTKVTKLPAATPNLHQFRLQSIDWFQDNTVPRSIMFCG